MTRILCVRSGFLGDIVANSASLRAIKKKHPDSHVAYSCWEYCAEIVSLNPYLDEIVTAGNYMTSDYYPNIVDFRHDKDMPRFKGDDNPLEYWGRVHAMQARDAGLLDEMESYKPELYVGVGDVCEKISEKPLAVLNVFSRNGLHWRLWEPFDKWAKLVVALKAMGYKTVQIGGKDDPPVEGIDTQLCGQTRLAQVPGILAIADLAIMIDSFGAHCCHADKYVRDVEADTVEKISGSTPTVLLAGPIPPECVVPTDAICQVASYYPDCDGPCNHSFASPDLVICEYENSCMKKLSIETVLEKVEEITNESVGRSSG